MYSMLSLRLGCSDNGPDLLQDLRVVAGTTDLFVPLGENRDVGVGV